MTTRCPTPTPHTPTPHILTHPTYTPIHTTHPHPDTYPTHPPTPHTQVLSESSDPITLSAAQVADLRKDIREQEVLLKAYQQENEAAVRRIKELQEEVAATRRAAAEDVQRLERQALQVEEEARKQVRL